MGTFLDVTLGALRTLWAFLWNMRLDCGCLNDGRAITTCRMCPHTRCPDHRYKLHNCADYLPQQRVRQKRWL